MRQCHHVGSVDANSLYVNSAAAEYINRCQRLDVLESVGKEIRMLLPCRICLLFVFCIFHFRTQHTERVGCLRVVFVLFLKRIESCYIVLETVFLKNVFFKYDISKYVLQKYIFYGYEASVRAFISPIFSKTSGKLCLPLCHKSLQEKG